MKRFWITTTLAVCLLAAVASTPAAAQNEFNSSVSALLGVGGSLDEDDEGMSNSSFQLGYSVAIDDEAQLDIRLGSLSFGSTGAVDPLHGADLTYLTIGGGYRLIERLYESGVYFALGAYDFDNVAGGGETSIGFALGFTGQFQLNRHFGVQLELAGHYVPADFAEQFVTAHAGFVYNF